MKPILVIQHTSDPDTGWLADAVAGTGFEEKIVQPRRGKDLPDPERFSGVVVLGGSEGAYQEDSYPYLVVEKQYLNEMDRAGRPILGICLGAQLLADALGGRAFQAPTDEFGYPAIRLTPAGQRDPVLRHLKGPVLAWHGDTFTLPPKAVLLAETSRYPYAYRRRRALGIQFHPEAHPDMINRWLRQTETSELEGKGLNPELLLNQANKYESDARQVSHALFSAWLSEVKRTWEREIDAS